VRWKELASDGCLKYIFINIGLRAPLKPKAENVLISISIERGFAASILSLTMYCFEPCSLSFRKHQVTVVSTSCTRMLELAYSGCWVSWWSYICRVFLWHNHVLYRIVHQPIALLSALHSWKLNRLWDRKLLLLRNHHYAIEAIPTTQCRPSITRPPIATICQLVEHRFQFIKLKWGVKWLKLSPVLQWNRARIYRGLRPLLFGITCYNTGICSLYSWAILAVPASPIFSL